MKRFEQILLLLSAISLVFKLLNFPISSVVLFISMIALSLLYYFLGFALINNLRLGSILRSESYTGIKPPAIVFSVGLGWGFSILTIGILFCIMNYPLENMFLLTGLACTIISLALILILSQNKTGNKSWIITRSLAYIFIGSILLLMPDHYLDKIQYRKHPDYLNTLIELENDPDNEVLIKQFEIERQKMMSGDENKNALPRKVLWQ